MSSCEFVWAPTQLKENNVQLLDNNATTAGTTTTSQKAMQIHKNEKTDRQVNQLSNSVQIEFMFCLLSVL